MYKHCVTKPFLVQTHRNCLYTITINARVIAPLYYSVIFSVYPYTLGHLTIIKTIDNFYNQKMKRKIINILYYYVLGNDNATNQMQQQTSLVVHDVICTFVASAGEDSSLNQMQ